jgi:Protein of unknown function (DUF1619)
MSESPQDCVQKFTNLQSACQSVFNGADFFNAKIYSGSNPTSSSTLQITIKSVQVFQTATQTLQSTGNSVPASSFDGCTCSNALKQVSYTVSYSRQPDSSYQIDTIQADVVLYDNLAFDAGTVCSGTNNVVQEVKQSYSLQF